MQRKFHYSVSVEFALSQVEVDLLLLCSEHHYDLHCRSVSQSGGFLNGIRNRLKFDTNPTHTLDFDEIDTLCKILEGRGALTDRLNADALAERLHGYLQEINAEVRRLNPRS